MTTYGTFLALTPLAATIFIYMAIKYETYKWSPLFVVGGLFSGVAAIFLFIGADVEVFDTEMIDRNPSSITKTEDGLTILSHNGHATTSDKGLHYITPSTNLSLTYCVRKNFWGKQLSSFYVIGVKE